MRQQNHFIILFLFIVHVMFSQENNYTITYITNTSLDLTTIREDKLYISTNQNKSIFLTGKTLSTEEPPIEPGVIYIPEKNPRIQQFFYYDFKTNQLYSKVQPWLKTYFIKEPIPKMNWQLHNETKTNEENITLHKATLSFRGRNYTAWYSTEYPIQIGPWKFNNLPGLAFEITEENNQYHWSLTKIEKNSFKVLPMRHDISRANDNLQSYVKSYQAEIEAFDNGLSRTISNISGLQVYESSSNKDDFKNSRNMDLERKYEWEE